MGELVGNWSNRLLADIYLLKKPVSFQPWAPVSQRKRQNMQQPKQCWTKSGEAIARLYWKTLGVARELFLNI